MNASSYDKNLSSSGTGGGSGVDVGLPWLKGWAVVSHGGPWTLTLHSKAKGRFWTEKGWTSRWRTQGRQSSSEAPWSVWEINGEGGALLQWWGQSGGLDREAVQRWKNQSLSTQECDDDVKKIWKLALNFQSAWLSRWGYLNSERTWVEEDDFVSGKAELASRPLLLGESHR